VLGRQRHDLRRAQAADPVHALGLDQLLDTRRSEHAPVAGAGDRGDAKALLELGHLRGHVAESAVLPLNNSTEIGQPWAVHTRPGTICGSSRLPSRE
jgi:hypothetical protein